MLNPIRNSIIAVALTFSVTHAVIGQSPVLPPEGTKQNLQPTITFEFPGGTVVDFIAAVKEAAEKTNKGVNVICPEEVRGIKVPSMSLRHVSPRTAMESMSTALMGSDEYRFNITSLNKDAYESPTFAILFSRAAKPVKESGVGATQKGSLASGASKGDPQTEVFAIRDLVEQPANLPGNAEARTSIENILQAVNAAFKVQNDEQAPDVMFHPETGLLIVRGTAPQQRLVDGVVGSIRSEMGRYRSQLTKEASEAAAASKRLASMRARLFLLQAEHQAAKDTYERREKLRSQGTVSEEEVTKARLEAIRASVELEEAGAELGAIAAEMDRHSTNRSTIKAGERGAQAKQEYDVQDLSVSAGDLARLVGALAGEQGSVTELRPSATSRRLVVSTEQSRHEHIRLLMNMLPKNVAEVPKAGAGDSVRPATKSK